MFEGFPLPDFDFDDDEPIQTVFDRVPTAHSTLTEEEYEILCQQKGFELSPDNLLRCTGNSTVYAVQSSVDGQSFAVKITDHKKRVQEEYDKRRMIVDSPYLVKTIALHESPTKSMLQMELCDQDITQCQLSEDNIWGMIHDIGTALAQLHRSGWMHLDISPGNILISGQQFKLADFGTLLQAGEFAEGCEGAGPYVSPEALAFPCGKFEVGTPTDIFSFGVVCLEKASNQLAPRGGCDGYVKLRNGQVKLGIGIYKCSLSQNLMAVINQMIEVDPSKRPTAEDLVFYSTQQLGE